MIFYPNMKTPNIYKRFENIYVFLFNQFEIEKKLIFIYHFLQKRQKENMFYYVIYGK